MKKNLGNKLDRAIAQAYTDLYRVMDNIKFSAKQIADNDFGNVQGYEDTLMDIEKDFHEYLNLKKYIELLEDVEEEA